MASTWFKGLASCYYTGWAFATRVGLLLLGFGACSFLHDNKLVTPRTVEPNINLTDLVRTIRYVFSGYLIKVIKFWKQCRMLELKTIEFEANVKVRILKYSLKMKNGTFSSYIYGEVYSLNLW